MATQEQLEAKALGALAALSKIDGKERELSPTLAFGQDYNKLLGQITELRPNLKDVLPPQVSLHAQQKVTEALFIEMHAYYQQVLNLLLAARKA